MDYEKGESDGSGSATQRIISQDEATDLKKALEKCLEENKGDRHRCKSKIDSFNSSSPPPKKPLAPLRLRSGSLTDV